MNDAASPMDPPPGLGRDEMASSLFANLVLQQSQWAMMCLGVLPHPETGKTEADFDSARVFIDTLEMIETKTRGNLGKAEDQLLKQTLTQLRMAYVELVNRGPAAPAPAVASASSPDQTLGAPAAKAGEPSPPPASSPSSGPESPEESKKRFTKKY